MTFAQTILAERRARYEIGKRQYRPNGGPFVTDHPDGLVGEALDECYDALNYLESEPTFLCRAAFGRIQEAAELLVQQRDRNRKQNASPGLEPGRRTSK